MNARTPAYRAMKLGLIREQRRSIFRTGGISDAELYDEINFVLSLCGPEQSEVRDALSTIAADMEIEAPELDSFRSLGPATLDSRLEA